MLIESKNFSEVIKLLNRPEGKVFSCLSEIQDIKIAKNHNVESYYIPFEYISPTAKIVIVSITPGMTQLMSALNFVQNSIAEGLEQDEILIKVKNESAFSGALRVNLIKLLDYVGLDKKLNIDSTSTLFEKNSHLVHTTSVLKFPVFINGKNYSGSSPNMLKNPLMLEMINRFFVDEIKLLKNALYIPLGSKVGQVLEYLVREGKLKQEQILFGLPHPSGANAERVSYFLETKQRSNLSSKTNPDLLEKARFDILEKIEQYNF